MRIFRLFVEIQLRRLKVNFASDPGKPACLRLVNTVFVFFVNLPPRRFMLILTLGPQVSSKKVLPDMSH